MAHETRDVFKKLESKRAYIKTKKFRPEEIAEPGPHIVRLPKGAKPTYVELTPYQEFCWRVIGPFIKSRKEISQDLEDDLLKAHMRIRPEEYLAVAWMTTMLTIIGSVVSAFVVAVVLYALAFPSFWVIVLAVLIGVLPPVLTGIAFFGLPFLYRGLPASRAKKRARLIDAKITGAMSFVSAMASADVPVDVIFKELSRQPVYGQVKEEAEWITRDTELLGVDILTAIRKGSARSPSTKFQDFLQGVVTTSTSGGQLKPYFLLKAEQFEKEDRLEMRKKMETLGMFAESFVTVVVAFPLFLVVIMAIMALISRGGSAFIINLLYAVVLLMIPVSQFGFIFAIWNMEREG